MNKRFGLKCFKDLKEKSEYIFTLVIKIVCGLSFLYLGVINPYINNSSIPNPQVSTGVLIDTEIASRYLKEEIEKLSSREMRKYGVYEFDVSGNTYTVSDKQTYLKVNKKAKIIYNSSNPTECLVKYSYFRVLPFTILGLFLILYAIFPVVIGRYIDKIFNSMH